MDLRLLTPADADLLERFLSKHRDTSMFLRVNARRAGLAYKGKMFQATYLAAVRGDEIVGVVAHAWSGMVLVQAPEHAEELARECVARTGRDVTGISGPADQVAAVRAAVGLSGTSSFDAPEHLFGLSLSDLVTPKASADPKFECRAPLPEEREELRAWRLAYDIELFGVIDSAETRERSARFLDDQITGGNAWVLVKEGRLLSLSAFNAALPDIVQLGGIYTPPELRGRGYAKVAVAASLAEARSRGATRAVLFTSNPNAERCYEAIGFQRIGEYGLVLCR